MTDLQKEFEATGYTSWINADLYPDGKIYTQEYTQWLEKQVLALRQPLVSGELNCEHDWLVDMYDHFGFPASRFCDKCNTREAI